MRSFGTYGKIDICCFASLVTDHGGRLTDKSDDALRPGPIRLIDPEHYVEDILP